MNTLLVFFVCGFLFIELSYQTGYWAECIKKCQNGVAGIQVRCFKKCYRVYDPYSKRSLAKDTMISTNSKKVHGSNIGDKHEQNDPGLKTVIGTGADNKEKSHRREINVNIKTKLIIKSK